MEGFVRFIALIIGLPITCGFVIAISAMIMHHRRKMEELRQKEQRLIAADIQNEFDKIRSEIRELRDVSMQYDLSFDTALQHVQRRLEHLERPKYSQQPAEVSSESPVTQSAV